MSQPDTVPVTVQVPVRYAHLLTEKTLRSLEREVTSVLEFRHSMAELDLEIAKGKQPPKLLPEENYE